MCCSEWLECLSWSYTEFSSAHHNFYIYHYLSRRQHCWRVTSQLFQCFGNFNLNQRRLEQDPGLGGPVGGLRTVLIKFEIIIFWFANWIQKHSGMISCNIFEDYMEAQDQIQRNFQIMAVFMHARASKAPYHRMRVKLFKLLELNCIYLFRGKMKTHAKWKQLPSARGTVSWLK